MCKYNSQPGSTGCTGSKRKSKSKLKRDADRMQKFVEKKKAIAMDFPFADLNDAEFTVIACVSKEEINGDNIRTLKTANKKLTEEKYRLKCENESIQTTLEEHQIIITEMKDIYLKKIDELKSQLEKAKDFATKFGKENYELKKMIHNTYTDFSDINCIKCKDEIQKLREDNSNYRLDIKRLEHELSVQNKTNHRRPERSPPCVGHARRSRSFNHARSRGYPRR